MRWTERMLAAGVLVLTTFAAPASAADKLVVGTGVVLILITAQHGQPCGAAGG